MKSRAILFASWLSADPRRARLIMMGATLALAAMTGLGASVAHAGPMPGGTDGL